MVYHNVVFRRAEKTTLKFMVDNCAGQNKNRFMMWFLSYMSIMRPSTTLISLSFLVAGHTKNFCDACFELCKRSLKGKDILSPKDIAHAFQNSCKCNQVVLSDNIKRKWYDWKLFLEQYYDGVIPQVSIIYEFEFRPAIPGTVFFKQYAELLTMNGDSTLFSSGLLLFKTSEILQTHWSLWTTSL